MQAVETGHQVVSSAEWLAARKALLAKEKELTRMRDELSRERRELPWQRVVKKYEFEGPNGRETLADLFGGGSQLIVYHFMFGPEWEQGCPSCSMVADTLEGNYIHAAQRDVTVMAVSRAPWARIEPFRKRMGWSFPWMSSYGSDFNQDYRVSFSKEEMQGKFYNFGTGGYPSEEAHGISVFYKDAGGEIFHTYSSYARGAEGLLGVYSLLDMAPKGRNEEGLAFPMAWVRHHDRYAAAAAAKASCCAGEHA